ncbi:hypothetical protein AGMMS49975_13350 [Clostridia bacterium]|nr:hypothetical protein AGMMS49975_13350 [Clostridia bacterium]
MLEEGELSPVITGGQAPVVSSEAGKTTTAATAAPAQAAAQTPAAETGGTPVLTIVLMYAAIIAGIYFFMLRPQKKAEKERKNLQDGIRPGDDIITTGGFYGRVTDIVEDTFVVEFGINKGVRVPVRKVDVIGIKEPPTSKNKDPKV